MRQFLSSKSLLVLALLAGLLGSPALGQTIQLLPNGEQTFVDSNGQPYSGGQVYFYVPSTTTPKTTYSESTGTTPNSNPVVLDAAGRAVIWGSGAYRQVLKDQFGNTIWDQITNASINGATFSTPTGNTANDLVCMQNTTTGLKDCGFTAAPGQFPGIGSATAANVGNVGAVISSTVVRASAVPMTTNAVADITTLTVPAGNWTLSAIGWSNPDGSATNTSFSCWISSTSATFPTFSSSVAQFYNGASTMMAWASATGDLYVSLSVPTTYYLSCDAVFSGGLLSAYGRLQGKLTN